MTTAPLWLWISAGLAGFICLIHIFAGGRESVPPLLSSDMESLPKYTNYYCWHLVSLTLAAMAAAYAFAAAYPSAWELAVAATLL
ncbi:MAG: hypothetical protein AAFY73_10610, partial [Pseudomonadota bacterium]